MADDYRRRPRRRGSALEDAILDAVVDILAQSGYGELTFEAVAQRAGAGKASIYRRWATRVELAHAAAHRVLGAEAGPPETGSLRGDLRAWIRVTADLLAGPVGEALRGAATEVLSPTPSGAREPRTLSRGWYASQIDVILDRARQRGEVLAEPTDLVRSTPGTLLRFHFLAHGAPISDAVIDAIVDEVAVPLFVRGPACRQGPPPR
ncbi:MAG TPA: TetR/AcrR family transcriptional regulator [Intrasporangium sp.]|nr:TetR/AcrR family transcriptional regulator [Intrasporangium sp.]